MCRKRHPTQTNSIPLFYSTHARARPRFRLPTLRSSRRCRLNRRPPPRDSRAAGPTAPSRVTPAANNRFPVVRRSQTYRINVNRLPRNGCARALSHLHYCSWALLVRNVRRRAGRTKTISYGTDRPKRFCGRPLAATTSQRYTPVYC